MVLKNLTYAYGWTSKYIWSPYLSLMSKYKIIISNSSFKKGLTGYLFLPFLLKLLSNQSPIYITYKWMNNLINIYYSPKSKRRMQSRMHSETRWSESSKEQIWGGETRKIHRKA